MPVQCLTNISAIGTGEAEGVLKIPLTTKTLMTTVKVQSDVRAEMVEKQLVLSLRDRRERGLLLRGDCCLWGRG